MSELYRRLRMLAILPTSFVLLNCFAQVPDNSKDIPSGFISQSIVWGMESNGFRAGIIWSIESNRTLVETLVMRATNAIGLVNRYVAPPGRACAKIELTDLRGASINSKLEKRKLVANLPYEIAVKDLPHTAKSGLFVGTGPMLREPLLLAAGTPATFSSFAVQDVYYIKQDGDYMLTVWPVIYRFGTNKDFVNRVDLLPVTTKIHLLAEPPPAKSGSIIFLYVSGLIACFAATGCLVCRWRCFSKTNQAALTKAYRNSTVSSKAWPVRLPALLLWFALAPLFFSVANAQFSYTVNNGTVSITGYSGPLGPIVIPDTTNGLPVTDIAGMAFYQNENITSAVIGNNVTNIGPFAFNQCQVMRSVVIGNSVTHIEDEAFGECTLLTSATLGSNVTWIDEWAFSACGNLRFITIPASVTNISQGAFISCSFLTGIYFEGNMPNLETNSVFSRMYYLPEATGWGPTYNGLSNVLWNPQIQTGGSNFGVGPNGFGFMISGTSNMWFSVEACTDLANPDWLPIQTNRFISASFHCNDPQWTNFGARFYRLNMP